MLIGKLFELYENDVIYSNVQKYESFIFDKFRRRIFLIIEFCKWCVVEEMEDILIGVILVKQLVEEGVICEDLYFVIRKVVDLGQKRSDDGR